MLYAYSQILLKPAVEPAAHKCKYIHLQRETETVDTYLGLSEGKKN